jgi:hypothetical protein
MCSLWPDITRPEVPALQVWTLAANISSRVADSQQGTYLHLTTGRGNTNRKGSSTELLKPNFYCTDF